MKLPGNLLAILCIALLAGTQALADDTAELAERTADAHAADMPVASPAATTPAAQRVNSRPAIYTSIDGEEVEGWLSWPAGLALFAGTAAGLYWYEQAFVRAGQLPPLS